jgi:hypothetical protein
MTAGVSADFSLSCTGSPGFSTAGTESGLSVEVPPGRFSALELRFTTKTPSHQGGEEGRKRNRRDAEDAERSTEGKRKRNDHRVSGRVLDHRRRS